ncbi:unnamed protein product, partial [Pylaiella littoralis]
APSTGGGPSRQECSRQTCCESPGSSKCTDAAKRETVQDTLNRRLGGMHLAALTQWRCGNLKKLPCFLLALQQSTRKQQGAFSGLQHAHAVPRSPTRVGVPSAGGASQPYSGDLAIHDHLKLLLCE